MHVWILTFVNCREYSFFQIRQDRFHEWTPSNTWPKRTKLSSKINHNHGKMFLAVIEPLVNNSKQQRLTFNGYTYSSTPVQYNMGRHGLTCCFLQGWTTSVASRKPLPASSLVSLIVNTLFKTKRQTRTEQKWKIDTLMIVRMRARLRSSWNRKHWRRKTLERIEHLKFLERSLLEIKEVIFKKRYVLPLKDATSKMLVFTTPYFANWNDSFSRSFVHRKSKLTCRNLPKTNLSFYIWTEQFKWYSSRVALSI